MRFSNDEFYFKTQDEMAKLFEDYPFAVENTAEIAEKCNVDISFDKIYLPKLTLPGNISAKDYLTKLCEDALPVRYKNVTDDVKNRLAKELDTIISMGFAELFSHCARLC